MKEFKMSMAKEDITPELGCLLYGYAEERHAERVLDPLEVGVVALNQGDETVLLISTELCSFNMDGVSEIRKQIAEATGVKYENIMFSAIHTHSAPVTRTSVGWGETDWNYINSILLPATIKAARQTLETLEPAVMGVGTAQCMAGINRREITENGEVVLGQNPDGPYDPTMTVLTFRNLSGKNLGTIVHFATHATAAGRNLSITRDWPGVMIDRVKAVTGASCMYINGAEGNVGPRLSNGQTTGNEDDIQEIGNIAGDSAEEALRSIQEFKAPNLKVKTGPMNLLFGNPPSLEEVLKGIEELGDPSKLIDTDITKYSQLHKIKAVYDSGEPFATKKEFTQTVIALDDLALVPYAFEAFCDIAMNLREKSPYRETLLLGLTGGSYGYMPTEDQIPYGGYEIGSFRAVTVPSFVDYLDKYSVEENVKLLNEMYAEK